MHRKLFRVAGFTTCMAMSFAAFSLPASSSTSEDPPPPEPTVVADQVIAPGEDAEITFSESEVNAARDADAGEVDSAAQVEVRDQMLEQFPEYSAEDIDTFVVDDETGVGDVIVAAPPMVEFQEIELTVEPAPDGQDSGALVTVSATSEGGSGTGLTGGAGPGMAPYWQSTDVGNYTIWVTGLGTMFSVYNRAKLMDDNDPDHGFYAATKKGSMTPKEISGANAKVKRAEIQTWNVASANHSSNLWMERDPWIDGEICGQSSFSVSVGGAGWGVSYSPSNCESYNVWHDNAKPGSTKLAFDQGVLVYGGARELAFAIAWRTPSGLGGEQTNWQSVTFLKDDHPLDGDHCSFSSTAESATKQCT